MEKKKNLKTAIFLTGAAARISQEVAMLDKLIEHCGLSIKQDKTLLAGFSSGSLNLAAINGAFSNNPAFDWKTYYKEQVLFPLTNDQVYKLFPSDHKLFPLLDTSPLRATLNNFLAKMNATIEGDLPFNSYVLTLSYRRFSTQWAHSRNCIDKNLNLSDLFMASTAIPLLFPVQTIASTKPKWLQFPGGRFADGGTRGTFDGFEEELNQFFNENEALDDMYIISPMREKSATEGDDLGKEILDTVSDKFDLSKVKDFISNISLNTFLKFLEKLQTWNATNAKIKNIYVSIPSMEKNFFILNFNKEEEQYNAVTAWVEDNKDRLAVPLQQYLSEHKSV
jgi:patatin-like phospholipase/acyl hydrolase